MMKTILLLIVILFSFQSPAQSLYDYYLIKGSGLIARKDYEAAEFYLTKAVERYPDSVLCYYHRGGARYFQQKLEFAMDDFNKTLEMDPDNYEVEDFDKALSDYETYLKIEPKEKTIRLKRAEIKTELGEYKEAESELKSLLKEYPKYPMLYNSLGTLYMQQNKLELAFQSFSTMIQLSPNNPLGYMNRASVNFLQGRTGEACTDWKKAESFGDIQATHFLEENKCP